MAVDKAIVVGCSGYRDDDIADLTYAHRDAMRFAEVLTSTCGLRDDDVVVLHDGHPDPKHAPTRDNILWELSPDRRRGGVRLLYFFFSGHGFRSPTAEKDFLLTHSSNTGALEDTSVEFDLVIRCLQEWRPQHVLLFLDACRATVSGGKTSSPDDLPPVDVAALCPSGVVSFCSCEPGRRSYESDRLEAGVFTAGICDALSDRGKCRTVYELNSYLVAQVPQLARSYDKPHQRPYTRVEPLEIQQLEIVTARKRNQWLAAAPIGEERRVKPGSRRREPLPAGQQPLCAIDFGTSYSTIGVLDEDLEVHLIPSPEGQRLVPSVLSFTEDLDYYVGQPAVDAERHRPRHTIRHVKRTLGTDHAYQIEGRSIAPELAASLVIRSLRRNAEEYLGTGVDRCIASYPANFSIAQTNALSRAFQLADLEVVRMVGEPNVASILLSLIDPEPVDSDCLVVDLGGGTFDVAVVNVGEGVVYLLSVAGSNSLGGIDYDEALVAYLRQQLFEQTPGLDDQLLPAVEAQLRREAERAKHDLGSESTARVRLQDLELDGGGLQDVIISIDREVFRALTADLDAEVERTVRTAVKAWSQRTGLAEDRIEWILLAGQGSKIFTVREILDRLRLRAPFITTYQEAAVAHGLCHQAGVLSGRFKDVLLLNVWNRGIAIRVRTVGDSDELPQISKDDNENEQQLILIEPSTTIATRRTETVLVEGERDLPLVLDILEAPDGESIGTLSLDATGESVEMEILVNIDFDSLITLHITDKTNRCIYQFQLNQIHRSLPGLPEPYEDPEYLTDWLDHVLQGFTVWPLRRISGQGADAVPVSLDTVDSTIALRRLDQRLDAWIAKDKTGEGMTLDEFQVPFDLLQVSYQLKRNRGMLAEAMVDCMRFLMVAVGLKRYSYDNSEGDLAPEEVRRLDKNFTRFRRTCQREALDKLRSVELEVGDLNLAQRSADRALDMFEQSYERYSPVTATVGFVLDRWLRVTSRQGLTRLIAQQQPYESDLTCPPSSAT